MSFKTEITKIHYDKNSKGFLMNALDFLSVFYGVGSFLKNFLYDYGIIRPKVVGAKVLSVGNLTTGGVGKTPVVAEIAKLLIKKGEKVAIVSRGYGGKLSNKKIHIISDGQQTFYDANLAGDEPFWLAKNVKGAIVLTSKNRVKASRYAVENFGVTYIILDDGFQHRKIHRDLDIVLIDNKKWLGNEKLLPAGPLREGREAFKRIDKIVIVSKNLQHCEAESSVENNFENHKIPTFLCKIEPDYIYNINSGESLPTGTEITAISGIGQPEQFYAFLKDYKIKEKITFDDHYQYQKSDVENIQGAIVTTEKDAVKLLDFQMNNIFALKLRANLDLEKLLDV